VAKWLEEIQADVVFVRACGGLNNAKKALEFIEEILTMRE
jgi:hypothetical protein